jgi:hypothetical protein
MQVFSEDEDDQPDVASATLFAGEPVLPVVADAPSTSLAAPVQLQASKVHPQAVAVKCASSALGRASSALGRGANPAPVSPRTHLASRGRGVAHGRESSPMGRVPPVSAASSPMRKERPEAGMTPGSGKRHKGPEQVKQALDKVWPNS